MWAEENGYKAVKCADCGLIFVNPRPPNDVISEANKVGVHQGEQAVEVAARRSPRKVAHYAAILRRMFASEISAGKPLKWLDVGAGYGEFVESVLRVCPPGTTAMGVEPMRPKVAKARELGIPVFDMSLEDIDDSFDVISLINVYSHVPEFDGFARQLIGMLKPGGYLLIETGNLAELTSREEFHDTLYLPDHLVFSGRSQMEQTFTRLGLVLVETLVNPIDSLPWRIRAAVKSLLRGRPKFPRRSPFRTILYKTTADTRQAIG